MSSVKFGNSVINLCTSGANTIFLTQLRYTQKLLHNNEYYYIGQLSHSCSNVLTLISVNKLGNGILREYIWATLVGRHNLAVLNIKRTSTELIFFILVYIGNIMYGREEHIRKSINYDYWIIILKRATGEMEKGNIKTHI